MNIAEVWSTAAAIIASLGGGAVLVFALSSWLGKVWASRIMQTETARHARALEALRDELRCSTEIVIEQVRHQHNADIDLLVRKRHVYERLAGSMRVFFDRGVPATDDEREAFLSAYDSSFLWAGDNVVEVVGDFLDVNMSAPKGPEKSLALQALYAAAMQQMRRDAGFADTDESRARYRVVSFGDWQRRVGGSHGPEAAPLS